MDEATMERLAKALVERLFGGDDVLEVEEIPPEIGFGRRWRIRLVTEAR